MINLPMSNFKLLGQEFNDIIQYVNDKDQSGKGSTYLAQRKTIFFTDNSKLSVTEFTKNGKIDYYHYDWVNGDKLLLKVHSEAHDVESFKTSTEPYHLHIKGGLDELRLANPCMQDLYSFLQFIRLFIKVVKNYN